MTNETHVSGVQFADAKSFDTIIFSCSPILRSFRSQLIRSARGSGCLAKAIQWIQSRRAIGVTSDQNAVARRLSFELAPAAIRRGGWSRKGVELCEHRR